MIHLIMKITDMRELKNSVDNRSLN